MARTWVLIGMLGAGMAGCSDSDDEDAARADSPSGDPAQPSEPGREAPSEAATDSGTGDGLQDASTAQPPAERGPAWDQGIRRVEITEQARPARLDRAWASVVTHTHNLRTGELDFDASKRRLLQWTRQHDLDAVGLGSPWEPVSKAHFLEYEGPERDAYYASRIAPSSVMDRKPIRALFEGLNQRSTNTLFYQDNETPKNRYGHMWYFGYHYEYPAWHHYSQDRPVKFYEDDPHVEINEVSGEPHWRKSCLEVAWRQRKEGAVAVWAHPTSWWRQDGEFVTNIATESMLHLLADGRLGGLAVMGYDAYRPSYLALWFHYLDTGAVVPGFAETDYAFDTTERTAEEIVYKNYVAVDADRELSSEVIAEAVRNRPHFASTGAHIALSADGRPMGEVVETHAGGVHDVRVEAYPVPGQQEFRRLELVGKGGEVLYAKDGFPGGVVELELRGRDTPHYLVARAFGEDADLDGPPESIRHFAVSDPVYFHPKDVRIEPVSTDMVLHVRDDSPWLGGTLEIQRADGTLIERQTVEPGTVSATVAANARVRVSKAGRDDRLFYIAIENEEAQSLMRYLYEGQFLEDHPDTRAGRVPPEAFRLDAMREALQEFQHTL